ncbi:hypothetical protein [Piscibacillus halophilus]|uniref:hypothetical protein n=1 Tax=Piscibacillus halophilus TaxID=571933 RepID=UPI00158918DB|nr:hypothetical protein [Piscibacillus halophilus]
MTNTERLERLELTSAIIGVAMDLQNNQEYTKEDAKEDLNELLEVKSYLQGSCAE